MKFSEDITAIKPTFGFNNKKSVASNSIQVILAMFTLMTFVLAQATQINKSIDSQVLRCSVIK